MKAKITHKDGYNCAPHGHTVEHYPYGAAVDGQVAKWALADGKASADFDPRSETKVFAPTETKDQKAYVRKEGQSTMDHRSSKGKRK